MAKAQNPPQVGDSVTVIDGNWQGEIKTIWPDRSVTVCNTPNTTGQIGVYQPDEIILNNEIEY